ncbi:hypothetical protein DKX38_026616 [Salix brachista]|uniref:Uncharacterized protein n=1 Tax=Salix brachista TaxID=2182728 RepID=A0A5N5J9Y9_9ROSI|nr:hypothetical protein DKX38_026616 [Salix brachista]
MIPFLEFKLASKGIRVSFISTPINLQRLPPVPSNLANHLKFVEVLLPSVDGLPENCQATIDVSLPNLVCLQDILAFIGPTNELKYPQMPMKPEDFTVVPEWIPFPSLVAHRPDRAAVMFHNMNSPDVSEVFVGFGTEYIVPVQQVHELAHGIKLSKLLFIWILRKPEGLDISELLPTGFLDRTSDRGIVSDRLEAYGAEVGLTESSDKLSKFSKFIEPKKDMGVNGTP